MSTRINSTSIAKRSWWRSDDDERSFFFRWAVFHRWDIWFRWMDKLCLVGWIFWGIYVLFVVCEFCCWADGAILHEQISLLPFWVIIKLIKAIYNICSMIICQKWNIITTNPKHRLMFFLEIFVFNMVLWSQNNLHKNEHHEIVIIYCNVIGNQIAECGFQISPLFRIISNTTFIINLNLNIRR